MLKALSQILIAVCVIGGGVFTYQIESKAAADKIKDDNAVKEQQAAAKKSISDLITAFSVSSNISPAVRIAVLDDQQSKIELKRTNLLTEAKLSAVNLPTLEVLRKERQQELELADLAKQSEQIRKTRISIVNAEAAARATEKQLRQSQAMKEDEARVEKSRAEKCLEIFDFAVTRFNGILTALSVDSGQSISSDFPNGMLTIRSPKFINDGLIVSGTNILCIGKSDAWRFQISVSKSPRDIEKVMTQNYPLSLRISAKGKNGESVFAVTPMIDFSSGHFHEYPDGVVYTYPVDFVSVSATVLPELSFVQRPEVTNYSAVIDTALRKFVTAQDAQFQLAP